MSEEQSVDLTFREAITELEESLIKYERGIVLIRFLRGRLENAQQRVDVLKGELGMPVNDDVVDTTLQKA